MIDSGVGSFKMDMGSDSYGVHKQVSFEGDQIVTRHTYDAEPLLKEAHAARTATAGDRWGEGVGTRVGTIPMAVYAHVITMGAESRQKYLVRWLKENPAFVTFDKFLK
jgi:hypothetical protein